MFHVERSLAGVQPSMRPILAAILALLVVVLLPVALLAQGPAQPQGGDPGTLHLTDTAVQLAIAGGIVWLIEKLKTWHLFPWMTPQTETVNRLVSIAAAGIATIGVAATFEPESGKLTISGLTATGIATGGWEWFKSFVFQELVYRAGVKPGADTADMKRELAELRAAIERK